MEIERKFLIDAEALWTEIREHGDLYPELRCEDGGNGIRQYYFAKNLLIESGRVLRFRVTSHLLYGRKYVLTYKKGTEDARARHEHEWEVPSFIGGVVDYFLRLFNKYDLPEGTAFHKTRTIVRMNGKVWEVDEFTKHNFAIAEIELASVDEKFDLLPWIIEEVTEDPAYSNVNL